MVSLAPVNGSSSPNVNLFCFSDVYQCHLKSSLFLMSTSSSLAHTTRLTIAYEGTSFSGWQIQPNSVSIQSLVEQALTTLLRAPTRLIGAGRTDAGVHALGQVAHFRHEHPIDVEKLFAGLNALLPPTIRVLEVLPTHTRFHAQHDALGKIYHYHFQVGSAPNPFLARYTLQLHGPIDIDLVRQACSYFVGTHDFTTFANEAHKGSAKKNPVRTIRRVELVVCPDGRFRLEFEGNGFLYKMVRNITGLLLEIGRGKRYIESIPALFAARDRRLAPHAAPANGLTLMQVLYPSAST